MNTHLALIETWLIKKRSGLLQIALVIGLIFVFISLEVLLFMQVGKAATATISVPATLAAWMFNRKTGVLTAIGLSIFNLALVRWFNPEESFIRQCLSAFAAMLTVLLLTFMASWAQQMRNRLQRELAERQQIEACLRASEERYRTMFNMANDAIFVFDLEGNLLEINLVSAEWLGYQHDELLQMNLVDIETVENANRMSKRITELLECGQALYESTLVRKDGSMFPIELNVRLIDYQGQKAAFSIARDITQRKAIETAEHDQRVLVGVMHDIAADLASTLQLEEVLERILKNIQRVIRHDAASIMLLDGDQVYIKKHRGYAERGQADKLNSASTPLKNMPLLQKMIDTHTPLIISDVRSSPYWHDFRATRWIRSYAGAPVSYKGETIGFINLDGAAPGLFKEEQVWRLQTFANYAAVAIQNARMYSNVQQMAQVDELTGLYNRRGLTFTAQREVHRALRYKRPLAVLLVDVDNFKSFNDLYSYSVGDEVLSSMAERMRNRLRSEDLVCRWGGDEFVVILIENTLAEALHTAEQIRRVITERPFETQHGPLPVTISIGVAELDPDHADLNALIDAAGEGLHHAKYAGRNQVAGRGQVGKPQPGFG